MATKVVTRYVYVETDVGKEVIKRLDRRITLDHELDRLWVQLSRANKKVERITDKISDLTAQWQQNDPRAFLDTITAGTRENILED